MKIEDGFNTSPKAPSAARQLLDCAPSIYPITPVKSAIETAATTSPVFTADCRSLAGSQGAAPGGSPQQGGAPGGSGSAPPQTDSSAQQPPNQTSQPTSNTPAQNQGANQTAPKTNPQQPANSTSNT